MAWFLIIILTIIALLTTLALLLLAASLGDDIDSERARIDMEVMRAERRLHDAASSGFQAMLDEARVQRGNG